MTLYVSHDTATTHSSWTVIHQLHELWKISDRQTVSESLHSQIPVISEKYYTVVFCSTFSVCSGEVVVMT